MKKIICTFIIAVLLLTACGKSQPTIDGAREWLIQNGYEEDMDAWGWLMYTKDDIKLSVYSPKAHANAKEGDMETLYSVSAFADSPRNAKDVFGKFVTGMGLLTDSEKSEAALIFNSSEKITEKFGGWYISYYPTGYTYTWYMSQDPYDAEHDLDIMG